MNHFPTHLPPAMNADNPQNEIVLYQPDSMTELKVRLENETVWLTQAQIAVLFGTKRPAITKHLNNIFKVGELDETSTCSILEHMGNDSKQTYPTKYYNLDAILSVGYRVNSRNATLFRKWATRVLKNYLLRGYAINFLRNCADGTLEAFNVSNRRWSVRGFAPSGTGGRRPPLNQPRQGLNKVGHSAPAGAGTVGGTVRRFRSRLGCAPRTSLHRRLLTSRT
ncbi:MAG: virulence RhuM family protein, partial [Kiritimatiellaeota bacterium]|nr:virulence RhuM family protein [Kiritimatiellota bacterium]